MHVDEAVEVVLPGRALQAAAALRGMGLQRLELLVGVDADGHARVLSRTCIADPRDRYAPPPATAAPHIEVLARALPSLALNHPGVLYAPGDAATVADELGDRSTQAHLRIDLDECDRECTVLLDSVTAPAAPAPRPRPGARRPLSARGGHRGAAMR